MLFLLDTVHVSLLQRGHPSVASRVMALGDARIATSTITLEEQLRGWLAVIGKSETPEQLALAYKWLRDVFDFFQSISQRDFDSVYAIKYVELRGQYKRLGKMDLRIAAVAITDEAILITRNVKDFSQVAQLDIQDWSV